MTVASAFVQGSRPNILRVTIDLAAVAALDTNGFDELVAKHTMDGESEICFHDAMCIEDEGKKKAENIPLINQCSIKAVLWPYSSGGKSRGRP